MDDPRLAEQGEIAAHQGRRTNDDSGIGTAEGDPGRGQVARTQSRQGVVMGGETWNQPMPANVEAERSILGSILLDNKAYNEAAEGLRPEDFSLDSHRRIYSRMMTLAESSRPIDMITLIEELSRHKELVAIGDVGYISGLVDGVPDRPSIEHYIDIVREKSLRRSLIHAAEVAIKVARDGEQPGEEVLSVFEAAISRLAERRSRGAGATRIHTWTQIPTLGDLPIENVKWVVEGMVPAGSVILWAGESGSYKTWLSLWLAKAVQEGSDFLGRKTVPRLVLYLDRENPRSLIQERCSLLGIRSSEDFRIWGGWQRDSPPMIGDRRLLEIAKTTKPLMIFDSFIRFHTADENSATEMGRVMGHVRDLANAGAIVSLQHHKPKAEGAQYRGSSDIKAGVDVAFALTYDREQKALTVQCFKNRFQEESTITVKPQLDNDVAFEVVQDQALQRECQANQTLRKVIEGRPGLNQGEIVEMGGLSVRKTRLILKQGEGILWRTELGPRGRLQYFPIGDDSSFSAFQPYSTENLKSSAEELRVIEGDL
jgi:DnaB-like helicase N terminal domain/AAA domain